MSFVNFNNKQESTQETYSIRVVKEALYLAETKNINRINKIVEGFNEPLSLNEAIGLFSDKLGAMQTLTHVKANALLVNEGQFSWFTQDTERQIGSEKRNTIEVYMYDNQGNQYREKKYEGYGEFGGMDYYELLARMNGYTEEDLEEIKGPFKELRQLGIDLAFGKIKTKDKKRKTLFPALVEDPRYSWKRHDFTQEAESDPNQSWFQDDEDDYEDDYYEDDDEWSDDYNESEQVTEARDWGTFGTPEAKKVTKDLDKALQIFTSALAKAHNDYMKAVTMYTDGPKAELGAKSGFHDSEGRVAVSMYTQGAIKQALNMHEWGGALEYKVGWMFESKDWSRLMEDLGLNEGRSINKISKDHAETVSSMASTVKEWKEAEGDRKTELLDKLRMLNKKKADLEKELDDAVAGKDKNIQLALDEAEELAYLEKDLVEIIEEGLLSQVRSKIGKTQTALKKKWAKKGGYENFGQDEIRKLQDEYNYSSMVYGSPEERKAAALIDGLDQWAMNYVGEAATSETPINEYTDNNFNPPGISRKDELNSAFFKKLMPRTSKTIKEATKRIESWFGGTMFTHVQYFEVKPNGNAEDRPTYRMHNDQYWLNDTQLGWAGRSGEKVNVTKLSVYDISDENEEIFLGRAYVDTEVYLKEHSIVFEELKRRS